MRKTLRQQLMTATLAERYWRLIGFLNWGHKTTILSWMLRLWTVHFALLPLGLAFLHSCTMGIFCWLGALQLNNLAILLSFGHDTKVQDYWLLMCTKQPSEKDICKGIWVHVCSGSATGFTVTSLHEADIDKSPPRKLKHHLHGWECRVSGAYHISFN